MQVKSLKVTREELFALKERIRKRELTPEDYDILHALAETVDCLTEALKEKDTSLGRLCKYLFGAPTETARNVIKKPEENKERKNKTPAKGHGRRAASEYHGGKKVVIEHPSLHPGDQCPGCRLHAGPFEIRLWSTLKPHREPSEKPGTTAFRLHAVEYP